MSETVGRPTARPRRRRHLALACVLAVLGTAAGLGWKLWPRPAPEEPPAINPDGVDPAVWRAVERARDEVRRAPESDRAWGRLGMVLLAHQFREEAVICLARAERLNPGDVRWPYYQAIAVRRSDPEGAVAHLCRAVAVSDEKVEAPRLMLADYLVQSGQFDEAETLLRAVLGRDPQNNRARVALARAALARDDVPAALAHLGEAVEDPRTRKSAHLLLAEARQRGGDRAGAEAAQRRAEALPEDAPWPDPFAEALQATTVGLLDAVTRGAALLQRDDAPAAIAVLRQAVADYPESSWAWLLLGRSYLRVRDLEAAGRALDEAVKRDPASPEAHFYLGAVRFEKGDVEAALPSFRRATERKPDYALAWYNLGHCLKRRRDRAGAMSAFRRAVECKPQFAEARTNLGELLADDGRLGDAAEQLRLAAELSPHDSRPRRLLEEVEKRAAKSP